MEKLVIEGGRALEGAVRIHGAKNAALPILAASILAEGVQEIHNVPALLDIKVMLEILRDMGVEAEQRDDRVILDTTGLRKHHIPEALMRQMRSSVFLMGPLLARFGKVQFYQPGGCAIGERKIDLHLRGLEAMGAKVEESPDSIICYADHLRGADIHLDFPSVGATENLMMAAVLAEGRTTIGNAAREPEIEDLQDFLNALGAKVSGAGTSVIQVEGVTRLQPSAEPYAVIPDRIVTGTLMVAAAVTKGSVRLENTCPEHLSSVIHILRRTGTQVVVEQDTIHVKATQRPQALDRIVTSPYPSFPTDLQSQIMVLLSLADGISIVKETIFEGRFKHVDELLRMGADIKVDSNTAFIRGVPGLYGATVEATDLRAGAALVIAALAAKGSTCIEEIHHIDRGYDCIELIFRKLGARIERVSSDMLKTGSD